MTDYIDLALKYGGFTSLDRVYLERVLAGLTREQKLTFITPPPSVINAYFAELYQKKSPEAATAYFLDISRAFRLFQEEPSFTEEKPFVRLNLSGRSYGFCFESEELGRVFAEQAEAVTADLLFEIAQLFPHYLVYETEGRIRMRPLDMAEKVVSSQDLSPLTDLCLLENGARKIISYNQEEAEQFAHSYSGSRYYNWQQRSAVIYII